MSERHPILRALTAAADAIERQMATDDNMPEDIARTCVSAFLLAMPDEVYFPVTFDSGETSTWGMSTDDFDVLAGAVEKLRDA